MESFYKKIGEQFDEGEPVIIAMVISGHGSAPRKPGAKIAFLKDGTSIGSIGGGALEGTVEKIAQPMWSTKGALIKSFILNNDTAGGLGMVCGGNQRILLAWLSPGRPHQDVIQKLLKPDGLVGPIYLAIRLQGHGPEYSHAELGIFDSQCGQLGIQEDRAVLESLQGKRQGEDIYLRETAEDTTYCIERIKTRSSVYLFGAGHVARPIVEMASLVGFRTIVLDDREQFASQSNFPKADEVLLIQNFDLALQNVSLTQEAYVVIVTRGHAQDQTVLEQVLETPAAYIGMIGSKSKVAHCFQSLKEKGFSEDQLDRVHAPIGLEIGSETPEEIAVSIVAQLIQVHSQLRSS